jgi:hypothetical protein
MKFQCKDCSFATKFHTLLLTHYSKEHESSHNFQVTCHINGCLSQYSKIYSLRKHISRTHKDFLRYNRINRIPQNEIEIQHEDGGDDVNNVSVEETVDIEDAEDLQFSNFFMKLRELNKVSAQNVNVVVNKMEEIMTECLEKTNTVLRNCDNINDDERYSILNPMSSIKESLASINSTHKLEASFKDRNYVQPIEVDLPDGDSFSYVSIFKNLSTILQHNDVLSHVYATTDESPYIRSFTDGSAYKNNEIFQSNPLRIKLYIDDFTIINPLSNKARVHKICGVYWTLDNIPHQFNSQLYMIQMAILAKSTTVKKHFNEVFKPLVEELKTLESEGITVRNSNGVCHKFYGTVSVVVADNLSFS